MNNLTISVVIPTYQRPKYLEMAVVSLLNQSQLPDEILMISRDDDENTNKKAKELIDRYSGMVKIENYHVIEPGFLPPIEKGIEYATSEIVAFLDDDAEAYPEWIYQLITTYKNSTIGGVGGRYENYFNFELVEYKKHSISAKITWYGKFIGNLISEPISNSLIDADFFIGGNMSFRRKILNEITIDPVLKKNVSFHWEIDVCQQVKKLNYTLIYNPNIIVKHHTAPREIEGNRTINYDASYYTNFNHAYIVFKHLSLLSKLTYPIYTFLIGSKNSSGLLYLLYSILIKRSLDMKNDIIPSLKGRIDGIRLPNKTKF